MRLKWHVGLSNGESYTEGAKPFLVVPDQLSPWLQLQEYLKANDLKITSLQIIDTLPIKVRRFHLPSSGSNPKFRAFMLSEKPLEYKFARVLGGNVLGPANTEVFARAEAVYQSYRLQLWVSENDPDNCWVLVEK